MRQRLPSAPAGGSHAPHSARPQRGRHLPPPTPPSPTCSQSPEQQPRADRAPRNQAPPLAFAPAQPTPLTRSFPSPVPPSCLQSDSGALHLPAGHRLPLLPSPLPLTGLPPAAWGPQESRLTPEVPARRGAGRQPGTAGPPLLLPPGGGGGHLLCHLLTFTFVATSVTNAPPTSSLLDNSLEPPKAALPPSSLFLPGGGGHDPVPPIIH